MAKIEIQLEKNLEKRQHKNFLVYSAVKEWIWCVDIHYTKSKHTHLMKENQQCHLWNGAKNLAPVTIQILRQPLGRSQHLWHNLTGKQCKTGS